MTLRFETRAAIVTGAGSGIGREVALKLAAEGAAVLALDIDAARLDALAGEATGAGRIVGHVADLGDPAECAGAVERAVVEFGGLDVVANVAATLHAGHFTDHTYEQYRRVLAVNLDGPFFLTQAAIPHLLERNGNVVNVTSNSAIQGIPYAAAYAASKAGLMQLTRALAVEYLKQPLRVNAVAPGATNTNIAVGASFPEDLDVELFSRLMGARGMADPADVANVVVFLASDDARAVTGAMYVADQGLTIT